MIVLVMGTLVMPIALFAVAVTVAASAAALHQRAQRGGPVATLTGVLLDRRVRLVVAFGALVVLMLARTVA